jgi:hypothetical protein
MAEKSSVLAKVRAHSVDPAAPEAVDAGTDSRATAGLTAEFSAESELLYFERLFTPAGAYPVVAWVALAAVLLVPSYLAWSEALSGRFFRQVGPVVVGLASIPLVVRYCYERLTRWHASLPEFLRPRPGEFAEWLERKHLQVSRNARPTLLGIGIMLVAHLAFPSLSAGLPFREALIFQGLTLIGAFFAGVGLYHVAAFGVLIWHLGDFEITVDDQPSGVRSVGGLMSTCWSLAALVWCLFTSTAVMHDGIRVHAVLYLSIPCALVLIASFVICQVPLHRRMAAYKAAEVKRLRALLVPLSVKGIDQLVADEMARIRFIEQRIARAAKLPEWPFHWGALLRVSSLSLSFVLPHAASFLVENKQVRSAVAKLIGADG